MFDVHMHSRFSADCSVSMENMVIGAIQKGLKGICFTEHIDYDYPDDSIVFEFDLKEYDLELMRLREKYEAKIEIQKGVEIGVQPHILHRYEKLMDEETFDFVICSMHTTDRKSLHYKEIFEGKTVEEAFELYYAEYLSCIKNFKRFNVLGHVDLIKRYTDRPSSHLFHDALTKIFNIIIPNGQGIELNTSGVRYGLAHALPSEDVLKLYKQCGGEVITLGSDAHRESELAFQFQESLELLQKIGFQYVTTFKNQQPIFHKIDQFLK